MELDSEHRDFTYYLMKQHEAGNLMRDEIIINGALMMYVLLRLLKSSTNSVQQCRDGNHSRLSRGALQSPPT
jgi:hypothetical protein